MQKIGNAAGQPARTRIGRAATVLVGTAVLGMLAACADGGVTAPAPVAQPQAGIIGTALDLVAELLPPVKGLMRAAPVGEVRRSITVGYGGGVLEMPETGLRLTIPRGAVNSTITISVKSVPGRMVAYEFEPHGTKFAVPIQFSQDLARTGFSGDASSLKGGYFKSLDQLLTGSGIALINEELPARVSGGRVIFDIRHFSGYLMSTGRASQTDVDAATYE